MEPDLVAPVRAALAVLGEGAVAVVALSGGADSAALAVLVRRARPDLVLTAAHVRHGLRDDAPDRAAAEAIAARLDLPLAVEAVTVTPAGEGVEAAARAARYAALRAVAGRVGAAAVLLGHTADDQAETVLLALGRGTGVRGLGGMRPVRAERGLLLVRPLLGLRRAAARSAAAGLPTIEDPTNSDPDQRRRRVRAAVLPALAELSGGTGDPVGLLTRLADLARDDADLLDGLAAAEAEWLIGAWGPVRVLRAEAAEALPPALRRRVVRTLLAQVRGGEAGLDAATVARVLALRPGAALSVSGGVEVTANAGWFAAAPAGLGDLPARPLPVPGIVKLPELGLTVAAAERDEHLPPPVVPPRARAGGGDEALLGRDALVVRARRPGDRVPGSAHTLGDRFTDLGVPRALRGLVPVVAAAADPDTAVWVPGVAAAATQDGPVRVRLVAAND